MIKLHIKRLYQIIIRLISTLIRYIVIKKPMKILLTLFCVILFLYINSTLISIYSRYLYIILFSINIDGRYFPAGSDTPTHIKFIQEVSISPILSLISPTHKYGGYPSLFHLMLAFISKLSPYPITNILAYYGALLFIIGPCLYAYAFSKSVPNSLRPVVMPLLIVVSLGFSVKILQSLNDGNYPELTVDFILIPLMFCFINSFIKTRKVIYLYACSIVSALTLNINFAGGVYLLLLYLLFIMHIIFIYVFYFKNLYLRTILYSITVLLILWIMLGPLRFLRYSNLIIELLLHLLGFKREISFALFSNRPISLEWLSQYMFLNRSVISLFIRVITISALLHIFLVVKYKIQTILTPLLINNYVLSLFSLSFVGYSTARIARYLSYLLPMTFFIDVASILCFILLKI